MKSVATILGAAALSFVAAVPAVYAGTKTINNNTSDTIKILIVGRGTDCSSASGKVKATIPANSSADVTYSATYMNSLQITLVDASTSSSQKETLKCTATGGPGTLDNAFNGNSIFEIGAASGAYGITFSSHN
ncbi:MAG TPA: hypothetical protein VHT03_15215 [Rhizomicrobium sp.]|jgi:hypothetical protein|nr:hypothetical protein [Rhizomicrobium sp.]